MENRVMELKNEIRADDFKHDSYGVAMDWLGAIADYLTESGLQSSIPGSWGYSAPFGVADDHKDRYSYETVAQFFPLTEGMSLREIEACESELIGVGNLLDRLIDMCRANGTDYQELFVCMHEEIACSGAHCPCPCDNCVLGDEDDEYEEED